MPIWPEEKHEEALRWYAQEHGMTVLRDVPLTGLDRGGWGDNCRKRFGEVAVPTAEPGKVRPFEEADFLEALDRGTPIQPLLAWGFADRPAFGYLATRQAYLARTWDPRGPVCPVAIVAPKEAGRNVASAYAAAGFAIVAMPGESVPKPPGGGGRAVSNDPWENPRTREDRYLHELWKGRKRKGWWLAEVPIGADSPRRLDAVVLAWQKPRHSSAAQVRAEIDQLRDAVAEADDVELIEAKHELNFDVIGQLLCGAAMFSDDFPGHGRLSLTACVEKPRDKAGEWFCARNGIRVEFVARD
jgi:hypothetical protein